jgi:hypothetical protein
VRQLRRQARPRTLACARDLDPSVERIRTALKAGDYHDAQQTLHQIDMATLNVADRRIITLLAALLKCLTAASDSEMRRAWRVYAAHICTYAWVGYGMLEKQLWLPRGRANYTEEKQLMQDTYWWLQIVLMREAGELPAWEGIRIVREQS